MATVSYCHFSTAKGLAREVYDDIVRTYGIQEPHGIYQLMGHTPDFLAASWQRSRYLYSTAPEDTNVSLSRLSLKDKHFVTLAVSATNNCEYCVRLHTARLDQLGMVRDELIELLEIVDIANGDDKFAEGVRLGGDAVLPSIGGPAATEVEAIQGFRAYIPAYRDASEQRSVGMFAGDGALGLTTKHMVALGVAATNSNDFYVGVHAGALKRLGTPDTDLVELLLVVDLACGYNRYVQGLQVAPGERAFVPSEERGAAPTCCT